MLLSSTAAVSDEDPEKSPHTSSGVVDRVEKTVEKGAKATGRGIEHAAEATARGIKRGANAVARGVEHGAKAVGHVPDRAAEKAGVSQPASQDTDK